MNHEKEITVILTVWKRNHLEEQINALLCQSKPPFEIWIQQTENHVDVNEIIEKYREKVRYFYFKENKGVYGRFESVKDIQTEYVFILDDDIIPGIRFLEIALRKSCELNAIISPNGRILNPETNSIDEYIGNGYWFEHSFCKCDTLVDFGNNAWLFKTEWIDDFLKFPPLYRNNGEDIQLSASLKLLKGIDTYVPEQLIPYESGNIKRHYSSDEHALHKRQGFQDERSEVVQRFRNEGWVLQKERKNAKPSEVFPMLSVVMFCHRLGDNIIKSIQSIINQSFADFEFVIIYNDEKKQLANIINELGDKRIRLIDTKEPLDKYTGLNIGCALASGKYICLMSDCYTAIPDRFKIQYEYMELHTDIVASGSSCRLLYNNKIVDNKLTCDEALLSLIYKNNFIEESLIIRKNVLEKMKYFKHLSGLSMFYATMVKLSFCGNISNIPECLIEALSIKEVCQEQSINEYYQRQLFIYFRETRTNIKKRQINKMIDDLEKRGLLM